MIYSDISYSYSLTSRLSSLQDAREYPLFLALAFVMMVLYGVELGIFLDLNNKSFLILHCYTYMISSDGMRCRRGREWDGLTSL